jgi:hypothetical protein
MDSNKVSKIINGSGFPLQLGIGSLVDRTTHEHGWRVMFQEHSWANYEAGSGGFIDLLLINKDKSIILNIECKRVKNESWIFLNPGDTVNTRRHVKAFRSTAEYSHLKDFGWQDVSAEPATPESQYCVIGGHDGTSRSMLEKIAAGVVESTEGFAIEDHSYSRKTEDFFRYYFNVIVTTATLRISNFDPKLVDISTGEIKESSSTEVPFLRFRKQLSTHSMPSLSWRENDARSISIAKENTVFIVSSNHIVEFLSDLEIDEQYIP